MLKNIIFDFDGVVLDSMPVRDFGFREIFKSYDNKLVDELIEFHSLNGGLSRFVKIRYFFENLLNSSITDAKVDLLAKEFSSIMKQELIKKKYLIKQTVNFIQENHENYNFHIASGSEHNELNYLCKQLGISKFFLTINGSPTHKNLIVKQIIENNNYKRNETGLIGDSINDYDAAKFNNIDFFGFNNIKLKEYSVIYIEKFKRDLNSI